jgi:uncharacterized membrane-anchored protein
MKTKLIKILQVIFFVLTWIALVILTVLIATEVHSENKRIIAFLLIGFIAVTLIFKGRREFGAINKTIK